MKKLHAMILLLYALSGGKAFCAASTPTISNITGTATHGSTFVINGSFFTSKSTALPFLFANFEDGLITPSTTYSRYPIWSYINNLDLNASNQYSTRSSTNVVGTYPVGGIELHTFGLIRNTFDPWEKIYTYQKRYFDFDRTNNQKFYRVRSSTGGQPDLTAAYSSGGGDIAYNTAEIDVYGGVGGAVGGYQSGGYVKNAWVTEEMIWQFVGGSGLGTDNNPSNRGTGIWSLVKNGTQLQHRENIYHGANISNEWTAYNYVTPEAQPPAGSKVYMDDIYLDEVYNRVMIGNAPTLAASTHREIQIPYTWTGTSVSVYANQGSFDATENKYVFVIDSSNVTSEGYLLGAAQGAGSKPSTIRAHR